MNTVAAMNHELAEGPFWHAGALFWIDIISGRVFRYDAGTKSVRDWYVVQPLCGLFPCVDDKRWLALSSEGFGFWEPEKNSFTHFATPEADNPRSRFNDGAIDARGRLWSGTYDHDGEGTLYRVDPDLSVHPMDHGYEISNGIGWSLDNRTMYVTDSPKQTIFAFDYDLETGNISNKRPFITIDESNHFPDGMSVDSEGFIWCAVYGSWHLYRFAPDGSLDRRIEVPTERPTSLTFGGDGLKTIYITTAWENMTPEQRAEQPQAGSIYSIQVDVAGQANRLFDPTR